MFKFYVMILSFIFCLFFFLLQDRQVSELAQDLAMKLGLKLRKAYISTQVCHLNSFNSKFWQNYRETVTSVCPVFALRFFLYVCVQDDSMASQPDSNGETASSTGDVSIGFWWSAGVMRLLFLLNNISSPAFHLLLLSLDIIKWA